MQQLSDWMLFGLGWTCGAAAMWGYFIVSGLLKTREEYMQGKK